MAARDAHVGGGIPAGNGRRVKLPPVEAEYQSEPPQGPAAEAERQQAGADGGEARLPPLNAMLLKVHAAPRCKQTHSLSPLSGLEEGARDQGFGKSVERLELEVGMVREGMRLLVFAAFCVCFCMAAYISVAPDAKNDSQWHISKELGLSDMEDVTSPASTFQYIMDVSSRVREFFPVSSVYVGDTLSKTMIGSPRWFRKGSINLHEALHPTLLLEWSLTARLTVEDPEDPTPPARRVVGQYESTDGARITCWALYCQGLSKYTFEYGEHQLDDGYAVIDLEVPPLDEAATLEEQLVLVALNVNTSHVTMLVEDPYSVTPRSVTKRLPPGTIPTECNNGMVMAGNKGLQIADMKYRPRLLNEVQFHEIKEAGDTLEDIATGVATERPSEEGEAEGGGASDTQELVAELSGTEMSLIRLAGLLSPPTEDLGPFELLISPFTIPGQKLDPGVTPEMMLEMGSPPDTRFYWELVDWQALQMAEDQAAGSDAPSNYDVTSLALTSAFQLLHESGGRSFTLQWWATGGARTQSREFVIHARELDTGFVQWRLYVEYVETEAKWLVKMNGAPDCARPLVLPQHRALCRRSPSFWCKAPPYAGPYDGVDRYFAIKYHHGVGADAANSTIQFYLDGRPLCGVEFPADPLFVPHRAEEGFAPMEVGFGLADGELLVHNLRLYPTALEDDFIFALSENNRQCQSLSTLGQDDPNYVTPFGQSCKDIGNLMDDQNAAAGCYLQAVFDKCPVSCVRVRGKMCFDGTPPVPRARSRNRIGRELLASDPDDPPAVAWMEDNEFIPLWASIEKYFEDPDEDDAFDVNPVFSRICKAELVHRRMEAALMADGKVADLQTTMNIASGPYGGGFPPGMMASGESFTLYFWAKTDDIAGGKSISLAGIDSDDNLCFDITASTAHKARGQDLRIAAFWRLAGAHSPIRLGAQVRGFEDGGQQPPGRQYYQDRSELWITDVPEAEFRRDTWIFYALIFDAKDNEVIFMVNDMYFKQTFNGLGDGTWGCNGLEQVVNTGSDLLLSPMRISSLPLSIGDMQRRYLTRRRAYSALTGPKRSRLGLSELKERPRRRYNNRMIALSPPLVLQSRYDPQNSGCEGNTTARVKAMLSEMEQRRCVAPFMCDQTALLEIPCTANSTEDDGTFFGRATTPHKNTLVYPEFAWILEHTTLVRGGRDLVPQNDYLDPYTKGVTLLLSFYTPDTQVASIIEIVFALTSARVDTQLVIQQLKLSTERDYEAWLGWTLSAMVLILVYMLLALKPGIAELREIFRHLARTFGMRARRLPKWMRAAKIVPQMAQNFSSKFMRSGKRKRNAYTANTSQPDALDIIMSLGVVVFLGASIPLAREKATTAHDVFGDMGSIDWANNEQEFSEKVDDFLDTAERTLELTSREVMMGNLTFWLLILFAIRMIIFMKVHPAISGICHTFQVVTVELVNFLLSFGVIFVMLAFTAFLRFGYKWDEFRTFNDALMTQFYILIGDSNPETKDSTLMAIYVVGFVFVCTLALLNFLLAIVVNGYTAVCEKAAEILVARSIVADMPHCAFRRAALAELEDPDDLGDAAGNTAARKRAASIITLDEFEEVVMEAAHHRKSVGRADAREIYEHLCRFDFLHVPERRASARLDL
eukprot:jgi/Tetstr1/436849/TSEL_025626.t1